MDDLKKCSALLSSLIILCIVAIGLASWLYYTKNHHQKHNANLQQGTVFPKSLVIKAFQLTDGNNKRFTKKNLMGQWSLLFFGFTHCSKICPTTLSELNKAYQILKKIEADNLPQVVFISVDPERDSPVKTKHYASSFNKHFVGATGSKSALNRLSKNLGIMYDKAKKTGMKNYEVNHSGIILVINPRAQWAGILTPPFNAEVMAKDFIAIQRHR